MRVYVSSHCPLAARYIAGIVAAAGGEVVSTWHAGPAKRSADFDQVERKLKAAENCDQIAKADALILVAAPDMVPGGKFVEAGYALGCGKDVIVFGRRENLLMNHPGVIAVDNDADLLLALTGPSHA